MSRIGDYYLGIAEDVEHLLTGLGYHVDEDDFDGINATVTWGDAHDLGDLSRGIVRALEDAPRKTREALFVRACKTIMVLDDLAGARTEPKAA